MRKNIGECSAIRQSLSLSSWKYLKYKLKIVSTKLSEFPQNTPYHIYIIVKHIRVLSTPFCLFQPVLGIFQLLRSLLIGTRYISTPSVSFNRYVIYFTTTTTHNIITRESQRHQANTSITANYHEDNHHSTSIN